MNHPKKLKIARKMMSKSELKCVTAFPIMVKGDDGIEREKIIKRKIKTSPFGSKAWNERKMAIEKRVERKIVKAKELAEKKRQLKILNTDGGILGGETA